MDQQYRQEIPQRLGVPTVRGAVAPGGLAKQDVVHITGVFRQRARLRHQQHRDEPQRDRRQERQRATGPAPCAIFGEQHRVPAPPARQQVGHEHQQRQHAYTLGDDAQPGGETAQPVGAPVRPAQEVQQQAPVGQRDPGHDQRVDLRALDLVGELERRQQRHRREQPHARVPQPAPHVPGQRQGGQPGQQRRQQEGDAPVAHQLVQRSLDPHQHRRLVGVELAAAMRKQPVAGRDHLLGYQREARFVRRPGVACADAGAQHHQRHQQHQPELPAVAAERFVGVGVGGGGGGGGGGHEGIRRLSHPCASGCGRATGTAGCGSRRTSPYPGR